MTDRTDDTTLTPGAKRAGSGEYVFDLRTLNEIMGGPDYSPVYGGVVEGERMIAALMNAPARQRSEPHHHPNEQWIYLVKGEAELTVDGVTHHAKAGDVMYIPADTIHTAYNPSDEDGLFFTVKDRSHSLHGIKVTAEG